jgi:predicted nucleic acid-binding protein
MRAMLDTNVLLDVLLDRQPFANDAFIIFEAVEHGQITGLICATSVTNIFYLSARATGARKTLSSIKTLLSLFEIAPVTRAVFDTAIISGFEDFEDAVLYACANLSNADCIITRNIKDFKKSRLPVYMPNDFIKILPQL